ncbi:hypothetical protein PAPYR_3124 [Paratrimastix pyriformis]|uniref:Uncharacterized protein n=1 Tax=Paratrimastix pyriformis TaxID=342808 RepID=A0ABQ8UMV0_9EUKA|nr:hypothetical protein PAPYR_3124 [Paratrimastix pyriformis]
MFAVIILALLAAPVLTADCDQIQQAFCVINKAKCVTQDTNENVNPAKCFAASFSCLKAANCTIAEADETQCRLLATRFYCALQENCDEEAQVKKCEENVKNCDPDRVCSGAGALLPTLFLSLLLSAAMLL